LATSFTNTTSIKSDFSIPKWEKNLNRKLLTNFALESIFVTK
jgi:hypothetical protein